MTTAAENAYAQIDGLTYTTDLEKRGVQDIIKIGIGFCQRDFVIFVADV